jgi:hypothetical protein
MYKRDALEKREASERQRSQINWFQIQNLGPGSYSRSSQGLTMHDIRGEVRKQLEETKEASADSPETHLGIETGL